MKTKTKAVRPFKIEHVYRPNEDSFKWQAVLYVWTPVRKYDKHSGTSSETTKHTWVKADDSIAMTSLGCRAAGRRLLRKYRRKQKPSAKGYGPRRAKYVEKKVWTDA